MSETKGPTENIEYVEVPFPTFYTNSISVNSSPLDFGLLIMERLDANNATIRARIVMTSAHAKMLLVALAQQIDKHEELFGPILIPQAKVSATGPEPPSSQSPTAPSE